MINGVVASMVGIYLVLVLWRGREGQMIELISNQSGFWKWAGALLTVSYLYSSIGGKTGEILKMVIMTALFAMILLNGTKLFGQVTQVFGGNMTEEDLNPLGPQTFKYDYKYQGTERSI